MKKDSGLTPKQRAELQTLEALPEEQVDTSDIPELLDWSERSLLPTRQTADNPAPGCGIIAWFRARARNGRGYQTDINRALREHVERLERKKTP